MTRRLVQAIHQWYEPFAIMANEQVHVIGGLLVGINNISYNFDLTGKRLDGAIPILDFSAFMKDGNYLRHVRGCECLKWRVSSLCLRVRECVRGFVCGSVCEYVSPLPV